MKKICFFGIYNLDYSRTRVLRRGLKENGVEIFECNERSLGFKKYWRLWKKFKNFKKDTDILLVGFPGYGAAIFAKLFAGKKIIFDAFTSIYDSMILDRKSASMLSFSAFYYFLLDFISCHLSDWVLVDTFSQKDFFVKKFWVNPERIIVVYVGADIPEDFKEPIQNQKASFLKVFFGGTFIPLQGVDVILKSAALLKNENIKFEILGSGQTFADAQKIVKSLNLKNVELVPPCSYLGLLNHLALSDISLGIFGSTPKAQRVIPNKVFDALALGKPIITQDSPASREVLEDNKNCLLSKPHDEFDLAEKIKLLARDGLLRKRLGKEASGLFLEKLIPQKVVWPILNILK